MNNEAEYQEEVRQKPPTPPLAQDQVAIKAALCAVIPGIGAVYNREYVKAVVHFSIFAGLVIIAESIGIFGLAAFSFYVFTIIDAYRTADYMNRTGGRANSAKEEINLPLWGGVLILMGVLFLLDNLGAIRLRSAAQFWPLILVFLGGYLLFNFMQKRGNSEPRVPERSSPTLPQETPPPAGVSEPVNQGSGQPPQEG